MNFNDSHVSAHVKRNQVELLPLSVICKHIFYTYIYKYICAYMYIYLEPVCNRNTFLYYIAVLFIMYLSHSIAFIHFENAEFQFYFDALGR